MGLKRASRARHGAWHARAAAGLLLAMVVCAPARSQQPGSADVPVVAAGAHHTCALSGSGSVFCWGANGAGQAGEPAAGAAAPHVIAGLQLAAIVSGGEHTCGLDTAGVAWCWGSNEYGQLGDGRSASSHSPRRVVGGLRFASITAGGAHTCALTEHDRRAFCWGDQWDRAAGTFPAGENLREPLPVRGSISFLLLSAGGHHTCGIATTGGLFCWGDNSAGQVRPDRRDRSFYRPEPLPVESAVFTAVATGSAHSCALATDGRVYCWGSNEHGQLGSSADNAQARSGWVATEFRFAGIAAGGDHSCGLTTSSQIVCWGAEPVPAAVAVRRAETARALRLAAAPGLDQEFAQVTSGVAHDCAASKAGEIWCWGDDRLLQLGVPGRGNGEPVQVVLPGR